ncbi:alpha/beta fold hydrolase [Allokutzneria albata]|uniref:Pimeloyl-ACP methyl ester carboxylesterase n=1 Tax=Allokutzneria albata TaxID=211114 RepID=A0A1H0DNN8_ALLAB|nr:alpha/beta hydrolase [Allokutzneria albata]SDN71780.1 Pimeloyl-ACP methyl ester carboxylesterase [Allokutzneria albata]
MEIQLGELTFDVLASGPESAEPVLLLHGFPQTAHSWHRVVALLNAAGLRTYAPNQRGYSPGARPEEVADYAVPNLVRDVVGIADALGLDSFHLVGHDWGAAVAWSTAIAHPERVRTLTAVSVPHPAAFAWARANDPDQVKRSEYINLFRMPGRAEEVLLANDAESLRKVFGTALPVEDTEIHVRAMSEPGALTAALNWYRAAALSEGAAPPARVPTTHIWSTADVALGETGARKCAEFVDAPYELRVLDGVSHWIPDEAPEAVAHAVLSRMAGTSAG